LNQLLNFRFHLVRSGDPKRTFKDRFRIKEIEVICIFFQLFTDPISIRTDPTLHIPITDTNDQEMLEIRGDPTKFILQNGMPILIRASPGNEVHREAFLPTAF